MLDLGTRLRARRSHVFVDQGAVEECFDPAATLRLCKSHASLPVLAGLRRALVVGERLVMGRGNNELSRHGAEQRLMRIYILHSSQFCLVRFEELGRETRALLEKLSAFGTAWMTFFVVKILCGQS
jgi:hypothetical protein